jgi:tetratricopeptide (TPR) repeat protein
MKRHNTFILTLLVGMLLVSPPVISDEESKTVIGPENIFLADGANALKAGDGEDGVRLTLLGLQRANGTRQEKIAHSNLCAGYLLLNQLETALEHCDWVLDLDPMHWRTYNNRALVYMRLERFDEAEEDIRKGQEIRPKSEKLKTVKGMYLDETEPVSPNIEVDERRAIDEEPDPEPSDNVAN